MRDEIQHIIEGMSPIELCMLEARGVILPRHLAQRAADHRERLAFLSSFECTPREEAKRLGTLHQLRSVA